MSLKGIMSISGLGGLFKVIAQTKTGFIVESLTDKKKSIVHSSQKVSMLDDISVYTTSDDKPLKEVLWTMKETAGESLPVSSKSEPTELKKYFKTVVPDFDEGRVYASDIKKIVSWYGLLKDILTKEEEPKEAETVSEVSSPKEETETVKEKKPAKKAAAKKKSAE